jgi:transposase-like protein
VKRDLKPIYTTPTPAAAEAAMDAFEEAWGKKYRAVIRLWRNAWEEFTPFLDYDVEIPSDQAALTCRYLVTRSPDPTGAGRARWMIRWKPLIDAFAITFRDRWPSAETY